MARRDNGRRDNSRRDARRLEGSPREVDRDRPAPRAPMVEAPDLPEDPWVISDTHFGHRRIAEYAGRPMDHRTRIIRSWQELVADDDTVLHFGDFAFIRDLDEAAELRAELPGRLVLIRGNHDRFGPAKAERIGIELVSGSFVLERARWMLHCSHRPEPERCFSPRHRNLHGHLHQHTMNDPRCINLSVEQMDYRPHRLSSILARLDADVAEGRRSR